MTFDQCCILFYLYFFFGGWGVGGEDYQGSHLKQNYKMLSFVITYPILVWIMTWMKFSQNILRDSSFILFRT